MDPNYSANLQKTGEYGVVLQVNHPIVLIEGLPSVKIREIVLFENGEKGEVFTINRGRVEVRVFAHEPIRAGMKATRTDQLLSIPVGEELLGKVINPLGEPMDPSISFTKPKTIRDIDAKPGGIATRFKITKQMVTGVALIDLMIPLGIGQRELVIGDRKTGKTSFLLSAIKEQAQEGVVAIYAAIAKKKSDIKKLQEFFVQEKISDRVILVATSSYDSPSLITQTPYAAMTIAEYFKDKGQNTLLILDDLTTHAKFYRELSLLAKRFPGRDSYPGDIFYVHSKLLERGGNFRHPTKGDVAISCLPVIEIVEGDLTSYVSTNVMGITDGHIYFDSNMYYKGMRPAVNIPLSVTRVGRQTLDKLSREINKELTEFLSSYEKMQNLSHFGQELTEEVKKALARGEMTYTFFNQPYQLTIPAKVQLAILSLIMQDVVKTKAMMEELREKLTGEYAKEEIKALFNEMTNTKDPKVFHANVLAKKDMLLKLANVTPEKPIILPQQNQHAVAASALQVESGVKGPQEQNSQGPQQSEVVAEVKTLTPTSPPTQKQ